MSYFFSAVLLPLCVTLVGTLIWEVFRRRKREYKISLEALSLRSYREEESKNVKISLLYNNEQVGESVSVLTFRLQNDGRKDISFGALFQGKIEVSYPEANVLDIVIDNQSDNVGAIIERENNKWLLSWSLLKKKEFIDIRMICVGLTEKRMVAESMAQQLSFLFRADSINSIYNIASKRTRFLRNLCFLFIFILVVAAAVAPLSTDPLYNAEIDGTAVEAVTFHYNYYAKTVTVISKAGRELRSGLDMSDIKIISMTEQGLPLEVIFFFILAALEIVSLLLTYFFRNNLDFLRVNGRSKIRDKRGREVRK